MIAFVLIVWLELSLLVGVGVGRLVAGADRRSEAALAAERPQPLRLVAA